MYYINVYINSDESKLTKTYLKNIDKGKKFERIYMMCVFFLLDAIIHVGICYTFL
jgi:hypothetical protein